jgi:hypothetical protein
VEYVKIGDDNNFPTFSCALCGDGHVHKTYKLDLNKENTCEVCGSDLEGGTCYNCDRSASLEKMKEKHKGMRKIPFTEVWLTEEEYAKRYL